MTLGCRMRGWRLTRFVAMSLVVALVSACLPNNTPPPQVWSPSAPEGYAVASTADLQIPAGIVLYKSSVIQNPNLAIDDLTGDLYYLGLPGDSSARPSGTSTYADALYRIDPKTGANDRVAGLTMGDDGFLAGVAATDGWVFWVEWNVDSGTDTVRRKYFAQKADGSQLTTLADISAARKDSSESFGTPYGRGFTAGGGTAMWFGAESEGRPVHIFDTKSATSQKLPGRPTYPGLGQASGGRVMLWGVSERGYSLELYDPRQPKQRIAVVNNAAQGVLGSEGMVWSQELADSSKVSACSFTPTSAPTRCSKPVVLWDSEDSFADLHCLAGRYAVLTLDALPELALMDIDGSGESMSWFDAPAPVLCSGRYVAYAWTSVVADKSGQPTETSYIRIITTR